MGDCEGRGESVWRPCGVVSLLTDFGLEDAYVGVMKGVVLSRAPAAKIVDLTHGVPAQDILVAAWHLARSREYFPAGTVHVAVVDPGVGSARRILVAHDRGQAFLAPDNGLLGPVLGGEAAVYALDVARFALPGASRTFHGRDVFAVAAAALAEGLAPEETGAPAGEWRRAALPEPTRAEDGSFEVPILYADRFGNLVTTLCGEALEGGPSGWQVEAAGRVLPIAGTYADVLSGEPLALVGSAGTLEVSVREGDASRALGLAAGDRVIVRRRRA